MVPGIIAVFGTCITLEVISGIFFLYIFLVRLSGQRVKRDASAGKVSVTRELQRRNFAGARYAYSKPGIEIVYYLLHKSIIINNGEIHDRCTEGTMFRQMPVRCSPDSADDMPGMSDRICRSNALYCR